MALGTEKSADDFDILSPFSSEAYAWDHPEAGARQLRVELRQADGSWEPYEFGLDDFSTDKQIKLKRALPDLSHAVKKGNLSLREAMFDINVTWQPYHCVLNDTSLLLFPSPQDLNLKGEVNLAATLRASKADVYQRKNVQPQRFNQRGLKPANWFDAYSQSVVAHLLQHVYYPREKEELATFLKLSNRIERAPLRMTGSNWVRKILRSGLADRKADATEIARRLVAAGVLQSVMTDNTNTSSFQRSRANSRRQSVRLHRHQNSMVFSDPETYTLNVDDRDADLDPQGSNEFVLISSSGKEHILRAPTTAEMIEWVRILRDTLSNQFNATNGLAAATALSPDVGSTRKVLSEMIGKKTTTITSALVSVRVYADGPTNILELNDMLQGRATEVSQEEEATTRLSVKLLGIGVSLIDKTPQEVLYLALQEISADVVMDANSREISFSLGRIHLNNQRTDGAFCSLLRARMFTGDTAERVVKLQGRECNARDLPVVNFNVMQTNRKSVGCLYLEECRIWIRPLEMKFEIENVAHVLNVVSGYERRNAARSDAPSKKALARHSMRKRFRRPSRKLATASQLSVTEYDYQETDVAAAASWDLMDEHGNLIHEWASDQDKLFCRSLIFIPVEIEVTIQNIGVRDTTNWPAWATSIPQLDDAKLRLNALEITNAFGPRTQVLGQIGTHFRNQALGQVSNVIGSIQVLGNPVGLLTNVGTGVKDFFYEPLEGLSNEGTTGMVHGVAKGTQSLVSNVTAGGFNMTANVTKSVGQNLAYMSFDSKYQRQRAQNKAREATSFSDGVMKGGHEFGRGIYEGVTGVVMEPYRAVKKNKDKDASDMVVGFGKGVAKGIMGVAVKPTVGLFDLASRTTEGLSNFVQLDGKISGDDADMCDPAARSRLPRAILDDKRIKPFDMFTATAQHWLRLCDDNGNMDERLVHCRLITQGSTRKRGQMPLDDDEERESLADYDEQDVVSMPGLGASSSMTLSAMPGHTNRWLICSDERIVLVQEPDGGVMKGRPEILFETPVRHLNSRNLRILAKPMRIVFPLNEQSKYTSERTALKRPVMCHPHVHLDALFHDLVHDCLGRGYVESHTIPPERQSIVKEGVLAKVPKGFGASVKSSTKHFVQVAGHMLYLYSETLANPKAQDLMMAIPLVNLQIERKNRSIKILGPDNKPFVSLRVQHTAMLSGVFSKVKREYLYLEPTDKNPDVSTEWIEVLQRQMLSFEGSGGKKLSTMDKLMDVVGEVMEGTLTNHFVLRCDNLSKHACEETQRLLAAR